MAGRSSLGGVCANDPKNNRHEPGHEHHSGNKPDENVHPGMGGREITLLVFLGLHTEQRGQHAPERLQQAGLEWRGRW